MSLLGERIAAAAGRARRARTTRPASRSWPPAASTSCPATRCATKGPTTPSASTPAWSLRRRRPGARARAGRRSRPSRPPPGWPGSGCVDTEAEAGRGGRRRSGRWRPAAARSEDERCLSFLRSRSCAADLGAGGRRAGDVTSVDGRPGARTVRRHAGRSARRRGCEGARLGAVERRIGKYLLRAARRRRRDPGHPPAACRGQLLRDQRRNGRWPSTPTSCSAFADGRAAALRRPPHLRGAVRRAPEELERRAELAHLGLDPLSAGWSTAGPARRACSRAGRAGSSCLLMDQRFVAGIGNIYSDEVAVRRPGCASTGRPGRCRPRRSAGCYRAVRGDAPGRRSSTGARRCADAQYVDLFGAPGEYQNRHRVYGREGEPCPRCGGPVRRISARRPVRPSSARRASRDRSRTHPPAGPDHGPGAGRGVPVVVPADGRGRGPGRMVPQPPRRAGGGRASRATRRRWSGRVAWCRDGPSSAIVTSVDVTPETPHGERGFRLG